MDQFRNSLRLSVTVMTVNIVTFPSKKDSAEFRLEIELDKSTQTKHIAAHLRRTSYRGYVDVD